MLQKLNIDDTIDLSDVKTLGRYETASPVSFVVVDRKVIHVGDIVWNLFLLEDSQKESVYICEKTVENESSLRLYFPINEFNGLNQGETRKEAIRDGARFLFKPPSNPNKFRCCDLEFSDYIDNGETKFEIKFPILHGEVQEDGGNKFCSVGEYLTKDDIEHPELLLLEVGGLDDEGNQLEEGGSLALWHGYCIDTKDLEIFSNVSSMEST